MTEKEFSLCRPDDRHHCVVCYGDRMNYTYRPDKKRDLVEICMRGGYVTYPNYELSEVVSS